MRTRVFIPPVRKPTGGVAVLLQMVRALVASGREAYAVPREAGMGYYDTSENADIPVLAWDDLDLTPDDIWLVPEGWVNALAPGLAAGARCVAYVQNWAYLFSSLPPDTNWLQLPVSFLAVSHPVGHFVEQATSRPAPLLRPCIDPDVFYPPDAKPGGTVRIAFMPRKNKALADQIRAVFETRMRASALTGAGLECEWVPIEGMDRLQVAETLRSCHMFLATGFPEGCPLPPLEAMGCGCLVVGYPGLGGWDYMRQVARDSGSRGAAPWLSLREVAWGGNGLWAADGDVLDAALALEEGARWFAVADHRLPEALANAQITVAHYLPESQRETLDELWSLAEQGELFSPARTFK